MGEMKHPLWGGWAGVTRYARCRLRLCSLLTSPFTLLFQPLRCTEVASKDTKKPPVVLGGWDELQDIVRTRVSVVYFATGFGYILYVIAIFIER